MFRDKNTRFFLLVLTMAGVLAVLSCAPGNPRWNPDLASATKAGFWAGLWHGVIVVVTFIISLFNKSVHIYEANNAGWSYNLGFLLGLFFSIGGGFRGATARRKKRVVIEAKRD